MVFFGDPDTLNLIMGAILLLIIYWVAKFIISVWTGS